MGILDNLQQMAGSALAGDEHARVAGGFVKAAEEHPGGLGGVLANLRANGLGAHVDAWGRGDQQPVDPSQVEQGLGGGFINSVAQHSGVSSGVASAALAFLLPRLIQHFAPGGQPAAPQGQLGGLAGSILSRIL